MSVSLDLFALNPNRATQLTLRAHYLTPSKLTLLRHDAIMRVQLALRERSQRIRRPQLHGTNDGRGVCDRAGRTGAAVGRTTAHADEKAGDQKVNGFGWHIGGNWEIWSDSSLLDNIALQVSLFDQMVIALFKFVYNDYL